MLSILAQNKAAVKLHLSSNWPATPRQHTLGYRLTSQGTPSMLTLGSRQGPVFPQEKFAGEIFEVQCTQASTPFAPLLAPCLFAANHLHLHAFTCWHAYCLACHVQAMQQAGPLLCMQGRVGGKVGMQPRYYALPARGGGRPALSC